MKQRLVNVIMWSIVVLMVLSVLALGAFGIYCRVRFGDCPLGEIPAWAAWIMFRRG